LPMGTSYQTTFHAVYSAGLALYTRYQHCKSLWRSLVPVRDKENWLVQNLLIIVRWINQSKFLF
jgi:hypothetical protein